MTIALKKTLQVHPEAWIEIRLANSGSMSNPKHHGFHSFLEFPKWKGSRILPDMDGQAFENWHHACHPPVCEVMFRIDFHRFSQYNHWLQAVKSLPSGKLT
jgi:hypothetical protein